ncbi:MAG TPA: sugar ABC transporter permease [Sphaerochaeta sp.]|nr:sugar ABC transporter permease [Sphaerochaeta sp.]
MSKSHRSLYDSPLRGMLYLLPGLAIYVLFVLIPVVQTIILSFMEWSGMGAKRFVGLANYIELFGDPIFFRSLANNAVLVLFIMVLPTLLGLALATIIELNDLAWRKLYETAFFMPYILSLVVVAVIWRWIYNPAFGVLNELLAKVGLASLKRAWLGDSSTALASVGVTGTWVNYGFAMVIFLSGYQTIPPSLYDAVSLDGGGNLHKLWYVALPSLVNEIMVVSVFLFINSLKTFDLVYVMTKGGPGYATNVLSLYVFKNAFQYNRNGYAAALAVTLMLIIFAITVTVTRLRSHYEQNR